MSKSILVIDTPKSCLDCKYTCDEFDKAVYGDVTNETFEWLEQNVLPQCPLQDTTELLEVIKNTIEELNIMYEENMDCLNYHLNGATEPLNNFIANIDIDGLNILYKALGGE